jgi:hypothetical protein
MPGALSGLSGMMTAVARAVMALAVRSLAHERRSWALAMEAEFEAASEDGKALEFAAGCLIAAWRELPAHEEGRFAIASHVLALVVIVPVAAFMVASLLTGLPTSYLETVNDANRAAVPSLAILVLLFAALNLRIAWLALDRDWARLAAAGALSAAATATLVIFSAVVFQDHAAALAQAAALIVELAGVAALAQWHRRLSPAAPEVPVH